MLSFRRSGLLALTLVSGYMADAGAQIQRSVHRAWVSDVTVERLQDSSILAEYYGESVSNEDPEIIFRVGFIPRFGCAPLITFEIGKNTTNGIIPVGQPADIDSLSVSIDGTRLSFPAVVDEDGDHQSIYMNASLQRRITTKLRVEVGNELAVGLVSAGTLTFSLAGSRDAISIANQNCRRHDPSAQGW